MGDIGIQIPPRRACREQQQRERMGKLREAALEMRRTRRQQIRGHSEQRGHAPNPFHGARHADGGNRHDVLRRGAARIGRRERLAKPIQAERGKQG